MEDLFITQSIYRDLLKVMSRPGTVSTMAETTRNLNSNGMVALAITLLDQEVSFCVIDDELLDSEIEEITLCKRKNIHDADFIFVPQGSSGGKIKQAKRGTLEYPDQGATVIYQVNQLVDSSNDQIIILSGPGIESTAEPLIDGIPLEEFHHLKEINTQYPLGIDVIIIDSMHRIMAIPRSIQISIEDEEN